MIPPLSRRLLRLPPYLFAQLDSDKRVARAQGHDLIDLGVGDPDSPTPAFILSAMARAIRDPRNHRYALDQGMPAFREAIAAWYERRFRVRLDPQREILPLIGSKEGLAHLPLAFLDPGDRVLVPDPCYPPYRTATLLAGGVPVAIPLRESNAFLADPADIRKASRQRTKILYLNYPNNPTGAVASLPFFQDVVRIAQRRGFLIAHDAAYTELALDGPRPPSFLAAPGAKEVGVEFHSLSKTFNMTGWRIGWVCGNRQMISALAKVKSNIDSGVFQAIQIAAVRAFEDRGGHLKQMLQIYRTRCDLIVGALQKSDWPITLPQATFYLCAPIP